MFFFRSNNLICIIDVLNNKILESAQRRDSKHSLVKSEIINVIIE